MATEPNVFPNTGLNKRFHSNWDWRKDFSPIGTEEKVYPQLGLNKRFLPNWDWRKGFSPTGTEQKVSPQLGTLVEGRNLTTCFIKHLVLSISSFCDALKWNLFWSVTYSDGKSTIFGLLVHSMIHKNKFYFEVLHAVMARVQYELWIPIYDQIFYCSIDMGLFWHYFCQNR